MSEHLKYPIGRFEMPTVITDKLYHEAVSTLAKFPAALQETLHFLPEGALDLTYREGGWTGRQVVHHLADSHMHCLIRLKWTLTEESPTIKPYLEALWAELPDGKEFPVGASIQMIQGIHARLSQLLVKINSDERNRTYFHPESNRTFSIQEMAILYAWHCKHHMGHLLILSAT
jgi:DinB superfamily